MSEEVRIQHLSDFTAFIDKYLEGYRTAHKVVFRGEGKKNYILIPSIYRRQTKENISFFLYNENHNSERIILEEFMTSAKSYINTILLEDKFSWVEYAQHFGVPTRLLDWTENPLAGLYFACASDPDSDGKIYILDVSCYSQISLRENGMAGKVIKEEAAKMIWQKEKTFDYPLLFRPFYFDLRMAAQTAWFMVWGFKQEPLDDMIKEMEKNGKGSNFRVENLSDGCSSLVSEEKTALDYVIIPSENKNALLHELNRFGINKATLFPGLDGIGASIEWNNNASNLDIHELI